MARSTISLSLGHHDGAVRLPSVVSTALLPEPELQASLLDGELVRVGGAFCAIDTIIGAQQRAGAIASEVADLAIAEQRTAAWIHGVLPDLPSRLQLCVDAKSGYRPQSSARQVFREVVLDDGDVMSIGGLIVTTPLRTALDLARIAAVEFGTRDLIRDLSTLGRGFDLVDCVESLERRRNLPNKHRAIARLAAALGTSRELSRR